MVGALARRGAEPLPRGLVWGGAPVAAVVLFVFFVIVGFPYDRLATWISWQVRQATGTQLVIGELEPGLGLLPGLEAHDVRVVTADGQRLDLARVWLRPALSWSWLHGVPAVAGEAEGDVGRADGVAWLGSHGGFEGELRGVDVARLPSDALAADVSLAGRLDADVDLHFGDDGPEGTTRFVATQGSLSHPALPLALPFAALSGELAWGEGDDLVRVNGLQLDGPLVSGTGSGRVGRAPDPVRAPLDLALEIRARDPSVQGFLRSSGARTGRDGTASFRVTGTLGDPVVR